MNVKRNFFISSVIFSLVLISFTKDNTAKTNKGMIMDTKEGIKLSLETFTKLDNGISYLILKEGSGPKISRFKQAVVHYTGWLLNGVDSVGKKFDSSVDRGQHFQFMLGAGQVIKGWDLSVADMKTGEKRLVILPSEYAYGARGAGSSIPANAILIFEIELFGSN